MAVPRPGHRDLSGSVFSYSVLGDTFAHLDSLLLPLRCNSCAVLELALCLKSGQRTYFCLIAQSFLG